MAFISNGNVAWEIPDESAARYREGMYEPPAGWFVVLKLPKKSVRSSGGPWHPPTGEIFVDDRRIQSAANAILRKTRKNTRVMVRGTKHAKVI